MPNKKKKIQTMKKIFNFAAVCIMAFMVAGCTCNRQVPAEEALEAAEPEVEAIDSVAAEATDSTVVE